MMATCQYDWKQSIGKMCKHDCVNLVGRHTTWSTFEIKCCTLRNEVSTTVGGGTRLVGKSKQIGKLNENITEQSKECNMRNTKCCRDKAIWTLSSFLVSTNFFGGNVMFAVSPAYCCLNYTLLQAALVKQVDNPLLHMKSKCLMHLCK